MKTVYLKLKEPVEEAKYNINDIICTVHDYQYCGVYNKIATNGTTINIKKLDGDVIFAYCKTDTIDRTLHT